MRRVLTSLILLAIVLVLSSCSSIDDFVVVNRSDAPGEVIYTFMRSEPGEAHPALSSASTRSFLVRDSRLRA
jgi:hypothetical protein